MKGISSILRRRWRAAGVAIVLALGAAHGLGAEPVLAADTSVAGQLNSMFTAYGNQGGHWTGADGTASVPLPDGRTAWLFSDTFLGTVNADGSRPTGSPLVHNTIVVQNGSSLVNTLHGGTAAAPKELVTPTQEGEYFWVADGTVENGSLKVLYNRYKRAGSGNLDFEITGASLATFALPALTLSSVTDLPLTGKTAWGGAILEDGAYTYVYGTDQSSALKFAKVARVPAGGLDGAWQFWTGSAWSSTESSAAKILSGVGTAFGVQKVGSQYLLVTQENNAVFDPQYPVYTSASPTGPFDAPKYLFIAPEQVPGEPIVSYDAHLHPQLAPSGKLLMSYNVNTLDDARTFADASIYRPRFVEIAWPPATPDPAALPAAPAGMTATLDTAGGVKLTWQPVTGATGYYVYQRSVTGGQTHFVRQRSQTAGTQQTIDLLTTANTYEFKVTAVNAAGEGGFSPVVSATPQISAPPAPTGVTAVADTLGAIRLSWQAVAGAWNYEIYQRDVTAGETTRTFVTRLGREFTSHHLQWLEQNHQYEFHVVAVHGGGSSPASATASATAVYALPPAPTGVTAGPNPDGTIALSWTAVGQPVLYWVYQRDVTEGEAFRKLGVPTDRTAMTAGFLTHNHVYEFKVSADNRGGEGPASAVTQATAAYPVPAVPTGLTAAAGNGEVKLDWTASTTPNVWYNVYQRDVTTGEAFKALELPVTTCCSFTPGYLANGHTYEFALTTISQGGESAKSNVVQAKPMLPLPAQVTGLTAAAQTDGMIKLSWTRAGDGLWYEVHRRDVTAGGSFVKLSAPVTTCCTFTDQLLTHNHAYEYKLAATNASGAGPQSAVAGATARYNPPAAPKNLAGKASGNSTIHLDWDAPAAGSFFYWIYYRNVTTGQSFEKSAFPTDKTEADLGYLQINNTYEYKVTAENQGGEGPATSTIQVKATGTVAPPSNLTAAAGDGKVVLSWVASTDSGVSYDVYQRKAGESWKLLPLPVIGTSMTADYLVNGVEYDFKVTATNWAGTSKATNVVSAKPMPPVPAAPGTLRVNSVADGQVSLSWGASASSTVDYVIEMRPTGGTWNQLEMPVGCCGYTVKLLRNATEYQFRIWTHNLRGLSSSPSNAVSATPMPPFPQPASELEAAAGRAQVKLLWKGSPTPNVGYWIEYRIKGSPSWKRLKYAVPSSPFTVEALANWTVHEFRVIATNASGNAAPSNIATAEPFVPLPKKPTGLKAVKNLGYKWIKNGAKVSWNKNSEPGVWYELFVNINGTWRNYYREDSFAASENVDDLLEGYYRFKIRAHNEAGFVELNPDPPVSVSMPKTKEQMYYLMTSAGSAGESAWASGKNGAYPDYVFDWNDDGCSIPLPLMPLVYYGSRFFNRSCERHDFGYRNHGPWGNRAAVDFTLYYDIVGDCNDANLDPVSTTKCLNDASLVFDGVRLGGGSHW
jgi:fibronectin type 3 domain-containing protein